ncbi:Sid related protein-like protein [Legionella moravica]|uniref:Sid related protein-like protein n=1 Tax=Legionella moravica TaxID=39962 RepID=A0A378K3F9_9GAMM|nr:SidE phosphodiesterase domain-containing protein [Legionella moravica]KTD34956.1 Sid related protein-like protein [Legionella moravica]STX63799.1 SidE protein [Legionella moravica]
MPDNNDIKIQSAQADEVYSDSQDYLNAVPNETFDANKLGEDDDNELLTNASPLQNEVIDSDALKQSDYPALKAVGASLPDCQSIFERLMHQASFAQPLEDLYAVMYEIGASLPADESLFRALIRKTLLADQLKSALRALYDAGARFPQERSLFELFIVQAQYTDKLKAGVDLLYGMRVQLPENRILFELISQQAVASASWQEFGYHYPLAYAEALKVAFAGLERAGASLATHQELFQKVIQQARYASGLESLFQALLDAGATLHEHPSLFERVIHHAQYGRGLQTALAALMQAGASALSHRALFEALIEQSKYADKLVVAFASLRSAGASVLENSPLFEAVIIEAEYAERLAVAFASLRSAGASVLENSLLFEAVINEAEYADKLVVAFASLGSAGASVLETSSLFEAVINQAEYAEGLQALINVLITAGAILPADETLFASLIPKAAHAVNLTSRIYALIIAGATLPEDQALFEVVIQQTIDTESLEAPCIPLTEADSYLTEKKEFFQPILNQARDVMLLKPGMWALITAGARLPEDQALFEAIINKEAHALNLSAPLRGLIAAGARLPEDRRLFERVVEQAEDTYRLQVHLRLLSASGAKLPEHRGFWEMIMDMPDKVTSLLHWFRVCGASIVYHHYLFEAFFSGNKPLVCSHYLMTKVMMALRNLISDAHPLLLPEHEGYSAQREQILARISDAMDAEFCITEGPLNKSPATRSLESILVRLSTLEDIELAQMRYDDSLGYVLQFGEEPDIYLSGLLREANFNHIELTDAQVMRLGETIQRMSNDFSRKPGDCVLNFIVERLPKSAQNALAMYVTQKYKNMNRLFRGEHQDADSRYVWISPADSHANLMANFLCGSLVNWSAAQLPKLLISSEERQILERVLLARGELNAEAIETLKKDQAFYNTILLSAVEGAVIDRNEYYKVIPIFNNLQLLFPRYGLVDRGEDLKAVGARGDANIATRRLANPSFMPSVTSFSVFSEGSSYFHSPGTVRTKLETDCSLRPVMNSNEGEILIPAGTTFLYTRDAAGRFFAREINSPGVQPGGSYWSSFALAEAYRNHLRHPYQDAEHQIILDGVAVERPNHGLAHTYRMMLLVDVVIDYFAHHACEAVFQHYCQSVTPEECEWIRVAAAYSITGRESEIAARENLSRYDEFRVASMQSLNAFLNKYAPRTLDERMHERLLHVVRWMGNPHYEQGPDIKNDHPDINERHHRNFIHRILTAAHKLDLPRCYTPQEFERAMEMCRALSSPNESQQACYFQMISYAIDLIRAHGGALSTDISPEGAFRQCSERYRPPFQKVSTSLRMLYEFSETVPRPKITEKYQLTMY